MTNVRLFLVAILLLLTGIFLPVSARTPDPISLYTEYKRITEKPLWPGFDPASTPVAIYDGNRTLLFGYPDPPADFVPLPDHPGVFVFAGRHPAVKANSSADLGGVPTATVLLSENSRPSLIVHEVFHVFQRAHHPSWVGNEVEFFVYPIEDAGILQLLRLETEAFRRALSAEDPVCWAREAVRLRRERYGRLPKGSVAYERGTELNEGLAQYVEYRSAQQKQELPVAGFEAGDVRQRCYASGSAIAALLDRLDAGWTEQMEKEGMTSLDEDLESVLQQREGKACSFEEREVTVAREKAVKDVADLAVKRKALREEFLSRDGWTLTVVAEGEPLWPKNFDPLNVQRITGKELLHTRWLKLGNAAGTIEILDRASLTVAAGDHPLFNGARSITVAGLPAEPAVSESGGKLVLNAGGIQMEFEKAAVSKSDRKVLVSLHP